MRTNILDININKIHHLILEHEHSTHNHDESVILMSYATLNFIKSSTDFYFFTFTTPDIKDKSYNKICGCNIAIADWLDFGEVEIR